MRRAKIVCTMGPAVESPEKVRELIAAGMNMARLNLSHGGYEEHQSRLDEVRAAAKEAGKPVAILVDLQGPKIRLARFKSGPHDLSRGDIFTITTDEVEGTKDRVGTTYKGLPGDCKPGDRILIDDGKVTVEVTEVKGNDVVTKVIEPGAVSNNKGINLPGVAVSVPALSEKDKEDLRWGLNAGADFIALSFVRSAEDIVDVHQIMDEVGIRVPVIAKIEEVPLVQKHCIELAREAAKPVIVATQMLDSMITNSRPTRAEATDCANAVLDGADALMLSGETSVGEFAIEAVQTMARIISHTEEGGMDMIRPMKSAPKTKGGAITKAATEVGAIVGAKYLVTFTQSGDSARRTARLRSPIPILAFTPEVGTYNRMALDWGVEPELTPMVKHTDEMVMQADSLLLKSKRCVEGELVVIVAGSPPGIPGSTNAMRVHRVGDAVSGAAPAYR
jgi:pyruvate kinase